MSMMWCLCIGCSTNAQTLPFHRMICTFRSNHIFRGTNAQSRDYFARFEIFTNRISDKINVYDKGDIISCDFNKSLRIDVSSVHHMLEFTHAENITRFFPGEYCRFYRAGQLNVKKCVISMWKNSIETKETVWPSLVFGVNFVLLHC